MSKLKIGKGEWVVVCDGAKALVLENVGDEKFPNLKTREVYEQEAPKTSDQGADVPGRAFNSVGSNRSAVEQTDWHDEAERAFLTKLVGRLAAAAHAGEAKSMILVAPPRALGVIRQHYTPALKVAVKAEVDKDYVKLPVYEIEKRLTSG
jgi:protein required for attachment to host cells